MNPFCNQNSFYPYSAHPLYAPPFPRKCKKRNKKYCKHSDSDSSDDDTDDESVCNKNPYMHPSFYPMNFSNPFFYPSLPSYPSPPSPYPIWYDYQLSQTPPISNPVHNHPSVQNHPPVHNHPQQPVHNEVECEIISKSCSKDDVSVKSDLSYISEHSEPLDEVETQDCDSLPIEHSDEQFSQSHHSHGSERSNSHYYPPHHHHPVKSKDAVSFCDTDSTSSTASTSVMSNTKVKLIFPRHMPNRHMQHHPYQHHPHSIHNHKEHPHHPIHTHIQHPHHPHHPIHTHIQHPHHPHHPIHTPIQHPQHPHHIPIQHTHPMHYPQHPHRTLKITNACRK